jgi:hypothetical protein
MKEILLVLLCGVAFFGASKIDQAFDKKPEPTAVYVLPDSTLKQIKEIHILSIQNMKENQSLRQYFDKEVER